MLFLLFQLGKDRYAIDTAEIVEVLPRVTVKSIPLAATGVAGVFDYHGAPVPLIDLGALVLGKPSPAWISTRIILIQYRGGAGQSHLLGLLAERATETLRRSAAEFVAAGVSVDAAPYLGPVTTDAKGIIQRVEIQHLLPPEVRDQLFRQPTEAV
jgi:chemotaxis-related protein WspB